MKKNYVKPELNVVIFAPEQMLAASDNKVPVNPDEEEGGFSNKRNDGWDHKWD